MIYKHLKKLLLDGSDFFWSQLRELTKQAEDFEELYMLSSLRKKALARKLVPTDPGAASTRLAIIGGCSLYPFHELVEHLCEADGRPIDLWLGKYDNYVSEIMDEESELYEFSPEVVVLLPSVQRCKYPGSLTDDTGAQKDEATKMASELLDLGRRAHARTGAEIIITNFLLPARHGLGAFRSRSLGSDWSFRKYVNLELGLGASSSIHICDCEFLASRIGGLAAEDARAGFESKQPGSPLLLFELAREVSHLMASLKRSPKKVLVLDLDNTIWGGVIGDDGLAGIELGDTSPRGEAFKAFQAYILSLRNRGVLLGVCSKNDADTAQEPFEKHPEMVIRMNDIVSFKANWNPKSENIREIADELNLGLDSLVFVDDNPAEIEIVRQFAPEVTTILLGPDPSGYVGQLQDCRLFEPGKITEEDLARTGQYRAEAERKELEDTVTDMDSYLKSLKMTAQISPFTTIDAPRISQLINKSNQFNLTTRRRTEGEVLELIDDSNYAAFTIRLKDRFGEHGLIAVVITKKAGDCLEVDTWLMSCRVLKRQVEEETLNELVRLAGTFGCRRIIGRYIPTPKNGMVSDLYENIGFQPVPEASSEFEYSLDIEKYLTIPTHIIVK